MKHHSFPFRVLNIIFACLQNMTTAGLIFGWTSISGGLLISSKEEGGPGLSPDYVQTMFVLSSFCGFLGPLSLGIILDYYGPKMCSLISIALISIGCILFGLSDKDSFPLFMPAMCLIAFGGPGSQSSIIHLSNLFPEWKATTTAIITGSFQLSFIIFLLFDQLWTNYGYSYKQLFLGYLVICLFNAFLSFNLWPNEPYSFEDELDEEEVDEEHHIPLGTIRLPSVFIHHSSLKMPKHESQVNEEDDNSLYNQDRLKDASLLEQIRSKDFIRLTLYFLVTTYWVNFFIGTFDLQLGDLNVLTTAERRDYARWFTLIITCGVIYIPLVGFIMDKCGFPIASATTTTAGLLWIFFHQIGNKTSLIISFICYSFFRTFLFTFAFAYLADILGFKYFGVLAGIMFVLGGIMSFTQVPLSEFMRGTCHEHSFVSATDSCSHGSWKGLNLLIALMFIGAYYFSYLDWKTRKQRQQAKEKLPAFPNLDDSHELINLMDPKNERMKSINTMLKANQQRSYGST